MDVRTFCFILTIGTVSRVAAFGANSAAAAPLSFSGGSAQANNNSARIARSASGASAFRYVMPGRGRCLFRQVGSRPGTQANAATTATKSASSTLIWYGNPTDGTSVFKHIDIETANNQYISNNSDGSYALVRSDSAYGQIFAFHKIAADKRAEAHGAAGFNPAVGKTYYIGWAFKLSSTVTNNAIFQWKAYGSPIRIRPVGS